MPSNCTKITFCDRFDDPHDCDVIIGLRQGAAAMSLIGCLFIMGSIWLFQRYRNFAQRLILYLSLAAALNTLPYFMSSRDPAEHLGACYLQAWWMSYFDWSVLMWIVCITYNVYVTLVRRVDSSKYEKYYHLWCWAWPLLPSLIPFMSGHYGQAGAWCWIQDTAHAERFVLWYIPMFLIIIGVGITYAIIIRTVSQQTKSWQGTYSPDIEEEKALLRRHIQPLKYYPVVYLFISIFGLANRIQNMSDECNPVFVLFLLHAMTSPTQGFANAVVYAFSGGFWRSCSRGSILRAWKRKFGQSGITEYPLGNDFNEVTQDDEDDNHGHEGDLMVNTDDVQYAANTSVWS